MPYIHLNELKTHYLELNPSGKKTIIMIHGFTGNLAQYYFTIAPKLALSFRVILYDIRGHGKTDMPATNYKVSDFSNDLLLLMFALNIEKAHIVSYSFGGLIALHFALKHPEKIYKLGIIECPNPIGSSSETAEELITALDNHIAQSPENKLTNRFRERNVKLMNNTTATKDIDLDKGISNELLEQLPIPMLIAYGSNSECLDMADRLISHVKNVMLKKIDGDHYLINDTEKMNLIFLELSKFFSEPIYA
ncbi:alpha/beta fold hydrolase [Fulvivirga sediminis]|uniref:Alpha/beta hydrolase n=1 Tax=Fulvivirga sediminis TaxID=2803949 RepID=A0A937F370_9BACT|nr:alpha/beta hydrolase [Fulvivirga sediminis]MBL3655491.1 alpha/beta hydrolase [Fulvivirga sediminis]